MTVAPIHSKELQFDPLLMSIHPNGSALTQQEDLDLWLDLGKISEDTYQLLYSSLIDEVLQRMQQTLQMSDDIVMRIASVLRLFYLGRTTIEQLPIVLKDEVGLPQDKIDVTMNFIQTEILPLKASQEAYEETPTQKAIVVSLALLDALSQYARINDQQITSDRLKIRSEKESVRGSVRNWLRAYRDIVGVRKHSAMERGQFLFHSENTKNLPVQERERVALILKSLDENEAISINPEKQEIIFPIGEASQKIPQAPIALSQPPSILSVTPTFPPTHRPAPSLQIPPTRLQPPMVSEKKVPPVVSPASVAPVTPASTMKSFNFSKTTPIPMISTPPLSVAPLSSEKYSPGIATPMTPIAHILPKKPVIAPLAPSQTLTPSPDQFHFSSGHILPAEKQAVIPPVAQLKKPSALSSFGLGYNSNPSIPVKNTRKKEVWEIPAGLQNVVDLRSDE